MRIVGGKFGGRRIWAPKGSDVRPTADRVKESVFGVLADLVEEARVLDLFAGSGALGLEAMSRGALEVIFVDRQPGALETIRRNVEALGLQERARLLKIDLIRGPGRLRGEAPFDLVFLDPPYGRGLEVRTLNMIARLELAAAEAVAVVEQPAAEGLEGLDPSWRLLERRAYGQTAVAFLLNEAP
ncbi:MAG: 16S rRNA (guanine(966)-N(2))-methyltransferase RsmD [Proteobacteria bacterium]|nr:16S rRNA (guanine(966)-N(2))-methyltransferase RsmD [Pseudomonadota bacterium]